MRPLAFILLLAVLAANARAAEPSPTPAWPLWDGAESVEQYAKRTKLEPTKTLDLGNGVKMEMVLIPAGKFVMGTPEPVEPAEGPVVGRTILLFGGGLVAALLLILIVRALRRRRWPQFSLRFFLLLDFAAAIALWGAVRERQAEAARKEYDRALKRVALGHNIGYYRHSWREDLNETAHEVTITRPFYLGKFEVTQAQYEQVVGSLPRFFGSKQFRPVLAPDRPVVVTNWDQTQEFCRKADAQLGHRLRLPTEAEWEFACRAGSRTNFCSGDREKDLDCIAWYSGNCSGLPFTQAGTVPFPFPVGGKDPNAFGLYDMHGNVSEWCEDFYGRYSPEAAVDPKGSQPGDLKLHVARGGSCESAPTFCRSSRRFVHIGWYYVGHVGFRVAADVPPKAP